MKEIRLAVVNDFMGSMDMTMEEEAEMIAEEIQMHDIPVKLVRQSMAMTEELDTGIDLLVIDWGGVLPGAYDTQIYQVRDAVRWAEEHPGKLLVIWTDFTRDIYVDVFETNLPHLNNIKFRFSKKGDMDDDLEKLYSEIKQWYGVTGGENE